MKQLFIVILLFSVNTIFSQYNTKCFPTHLTFETSDRVSSYDTGLKNVFGFENTDFAIDIEMVALSEESDLFKKDIRSGAYEFAHDMGLYDLTDGGSIAGFSNSFYILAHENEDRMKIPVYILAIINEEENTAYEITVYCFNQNEAEGKFITESFKNIYLN